MIRVGAMNTVVSSGNSSYDEVPYESFPFKHSHPDHLATTAGLFGMQAASIDNCRVLELGCASGGNLIPIACNFPESRFVGIDLSAVQIEAGRKSIEALGLKNIDLKLASIIDIDETFGVFDYIIVHGVYSWVPAEVRQAIFSICSRNLSDNGVAFVSYNVLPGWHFRGMIRDLMLYHTAQFKDANTKTAEARAIVEFLAESLPADAGPLRMIVRRECDSLKRQGDSYLLHEYLEDNNQPVYFHEFVESAETHGLQFLSEAEFHLTLCNEFPQKVSEDLRRLSREVVKAEQCMDFLRNRFFRQTLLCKRLQQLNRDINATRIKALYISCRVNSFKLNTNDQAENIALSGGTVRASNPLLKAALHHLGEIWPQSILFADLLSVASSKLGFSMKAMPTEEEDKLASKLFALYCNNLLDLRTKPASFVTFVSERPKVSKLVRHQLKSGLSITNQLHQHIRTDSLGRALMSLCDGTNNLESLVFALVNRVSDGSLNLHSDGMKFTDKNEIRKAILPFVDELFISMCRTAVLVG